MSLCLHKSECRSHTHRKLQVYNQYFHSSNFHQYFHQNVIWKTQHHVFHNAVRRYLKSFAEKSSLEYACIDDLVNYYPFNICMTYTTSKVHYYLMYMTSVNVTLDVTTKLRMKINNEIIFKNNDIVIKPNLRPLCNLFPLVLICITWRFGPMSLPFCSWERFICIVAVETGGLFCIVSLQ